MYLGVLPGQRARYIPRTTKLIFLSHATWLPHQTTSLASGHVFAGLPPNHLKTIVVGILGRDERTRHQTRCRWDLWVDHIYVTPVCGKNQHCPDDPGLTARPATPWTPRLLQEAGSLRE